MANSRKPSDESIYQLKVTLRDIRPPIWRRVRVPASITLQGLHEVIQVIMGWANNHLYMFESGESRYSEPHPDWGFEVKDAGCTRLSKVARGEKAKLYYIYDMGDYWQHEVLVEKVLQAEPGARYPVCLKRKRACPPEDCGGAWGYESFLEAISDPGHDEHAEVLEWVGGEFDPEEFDLEEVNRALEKLGRKG